MRDKHQTIEEPDEVKVSRPVLKTNGVGDNLVEFNYSVRAAQIAVYEFLGIDRQIPPISPHDKSLQVEFKALVKAFR